MILLMTTAPPMESPWGLSRKFPPLGLAYVAAALEKAGYQVEVLDNYNLRNSIDDIKLEIKRLKPEIMGITCGSVTYRQCIETAKAVKEVLPSCKIVVGGWHPSFMPDSMLQHAEIDYVVMGEGERAMVDLADRITQGKGQSAIAEIPGVAFMHGEKKVKNPPTFIDDLDKVPFPARHLLPMNLYNRKIEYLSVEPVDIMNIIRGCPFNCTYCEVKGLWGQTCRRFSPSRVMEEINELVQNYGSKGIYFIAESFTINKKETIELCRLIKKSKLDIEWACDTRVELISRELLREMKSAGCRTIWFGIDSGSPRILKKLDKNMTLKQVTNAFRLCKEEGIQTACSFLLGIPGETASDMKATYDFAKKLDPDWCGFNIFIAVPGSALYEEIMRDGLYDRVDDFVAFVKTKEFNFDSLLEVQKQFHKNFNRSPKRILRKIRKEGFLTMLKKSPRLFS